MRIWTYNATGATAPEDEQLDVCIYCSARLATLRSLRDPDPRRSLDLQFQACPVCGWWVVSNVPDNSGNLGWEKSMPRACGSLVNFDISDIALPTAELHEYLTKHYTDRFYLHPKKYEDIVGSVFRGFGYEVRITSYAGDQGIDLFVLDATTNNVVGVQVKRHRGRIEAHQIREFVGALVLGGLTRGVFVTTSHYRRGARGAASIAAERGVAVELWNADDFYQKLCLTSRPPYDRSDDLTAPYHRFYEQPESLPLIKRDGGWYEV